MIKRERIILGRIANRVREKREGKGGENRISKIIHKRGMEKMGGIMGKTKFWEKSEIRVEKKEGKDNKLLFWNIAALKNKNTVF